MSWCWSCGREDPERCPYFNIITDCTYGGGCYLEKLEDEEELHDSKNIRTEG